MLIRAREFVEGHADFLQLLPASVCLLIAPHYLTLQRLTALGQGGVLNLYSKVITSVKSDSFADMGACQ